MRTITYGGAISLDGYLTAGDGAIDWLHFSKDVSAVMAEYWKNVDTILAGRKTWEFMAGHEAPAETKSKKPAKKPAKRKQPAMRTYVFSRTLKAIERPGVELVSTDAAQFVRDLKRQPGREICLMGGGELAQTLLAAGLVDFVRLNVHPILLGAGAPAFRDPGHRVKLKLTECREIDGGCVLVSYDVVNDRASRRKE